MEILADVSFFSILAVLSILLSASRAAKRGPCRVTTGNATRESETPVAVCNKAESKPDSLVLRVISLKLITMKDSKTLGQLLLHNKYFGETVAEIVPLFLRSGRERGLSEVTMLNREIFCRWLVRDYGIWQADSIRGHELHGISREWSVSRAKHLSTFLRWANRRGHIPIDHTTGVFEFRRELRTIRYLSPESSRKFLDAVLPPYSAAFALALYAGLRPYEICRLRWREIHFGERKIIVPAAVSKTVNPSSSLGEGKSVPRPMDRASRRVSRGVFHEK